MLLRGLVAITKGDSLTGVGHAFRKNAAGAFGPDLAKKLTQLVKMEKNVMRSLEQVAKERMEVAVREYPSGLQTKRTSWDRAY